MEAELQDLEETAESLRRDVAGMSRDLEILRNDKLPLVASCESLKQLLEVRQQAEKGLTKEINQSSEEECRL